MSSQPQHHKLSMKDWLSGERAFHSGAEFNSEWNEDKKDGWVAAQATQKRVARKLLALPLRYKYTRNLAQNQLEKETN